MSFSKNFMWGAATAAYQIEGSYNADGKSDSIWDTFSKKDGAIFEGHTGFTSCDHYHRYKEDVALMKQIGITHYRFSFNWTRILPQGTGVINKKGIEFYNNLIDELIAAGIEPCATIFHWDYPEILYQKGGWLNDDSSDWFNEFSKILVDHFSDRVTKWFILNEPQCFASGHANNWEHAPSTNLSDEQQMILVRNILLAYGKASMTIRKYAKKSPLVGFAPTSSSCVPATDSKDDIEAARILMYEHKVPANEKLFTSSLWSDPIFFGKYPKEIFEGTNCKPLIKDGDMDIIHQVPDFCAFNHYFANTVRMGKNGPQVCKKPIGYAHTDMGWEYKPETLYWATKFHYERYQKPIIITENGLASIDWICADGKVHDAPRIDCIGTHLQALQKAANEGIPIAGYFYWSLMDNFEWAWGYSKRFGIIHVDYETQKRTLKDSALFYKKMIESQGSLIETPEKWF
ncbi:MAG: GH1 family beta-glucosidase [Treponemataceae bacterium]